MTTSREREPQGQPSCPVAEKSSRSWGAGIRAWARHGVHGVDAFKGQGGGGERAGEGVGDGGGDKRSGSKERLTTWLTTRLTAISKGKVNPLR